jgi:hypothetical protein
MPLTDPGSYVGVMDEISPHWEDVNTELGGAPATDLKIAGGMTRALFITLRNDVSAKLIDEQDLENPAKSRRRIE